VKLVDHLVAGLHIDIDKRKEEAAKRQRLETQLCKLLAELIDTERKYVKDLEKACEEYLPLAGKLARTRAQGDTHGKAGQLQSGGSMTLNRKRRKSRRRRRSVGEASLTHDSSGSSGQSSSGGSRSSQESTLTLVSKRRSASALVLEPSTNIPKVSQLEAKLMLGNIEELRDYHKHVMLPKMETAVDNAVIMRQLFEGEQARLSRKYGRYCINNSRSSIIVDQNIQFFSSYQFTNNLELRVDAMLIKPIQRLTRYHMFLSSISKTCQELGLAEAGAEFSLALDSVLAAASHTNIMMWIGRMVNCPIDLPSQGQLIKHGNVTKRNILVPSGAGGRLARRFSSPKWVSCHLFLFQKTLMLCKTSDNLSEPNNPHLIYEHHISISQVRVRDVIADDETTFEVHKLEHIKDPAGKETAGPGRGEAGAERTSGIVMRLQCESEETKNAWVKAINSEVKQLRSAAKNISSSHQMFIL